MKYLHYEVNAGPNDTIVVHLDRQANVRIMDSHNFAKYRAGRSFQYRGGRAVKSPVCLNPPQRGHWHVVIDMGGARGSVRASVECH